MNDSKQALTSKTVLANLIISAAAELIPNGATWIAAHPQTAILVCAGLNIVLRHFSDSGIHWIYPKND